MKSTPYFISNPKKGDDGLVFLSSELGEVVTSLFPFSLFVCVCVFLDCPSGKIFLNSQTHKVPDPCLYPTSRP